MRHVEIEKKLMKDIRSYSEDKRKKYEKIKSAENNYDTVGIDHELLLNDEYYKINETQQNIGKSSTALAIYDDKILEKSQLQRLELGRISEDYLSLKKTRFQLLPYEEHKRRLKKLRALKPPVPLYKQMEDKFVEEKILPEQEKFKLAIEWKKQQARSVSLYELKEHKNKVQLWYKNHNVQKQIEEMSPARESLKLMKKVYPLHSSFQEILKKPNQFEVEQKKHQDKLKFIYKSKQYSKLLQEVAVSTKQFDQQNQLYGQENSQDLSLADNRDYAQSLHIPIYSSSPTQLNHRRNHSRSQQIKFYDNNIELSEDHTPNSIQTKSRKIKAELPPIPKRKSRVQTQNQQNINLNSLRIDSSATKYTSPINNRLQLQQKSNELQHPHIFQNEDSPYRRVIPKQSSSTKSMNYHRLDLAKRDEYSGPRPQYKNYLKDIRTKHQKQNQSQTNTNLNAQDNYDSVGNNELGIYKHHNGKISQKWQKIISSNQMDPREKLDKIKLESQKLEEKAKRMEELTKFERNPLNYGMGRSGDDPNMWWVDDSQQVNDLLVESIKAKLEILNKL
eukprot:403340691